MANATFDGNQSAIIYQPQFAEANDGGMTTNTVQLQFRTKTGGTLVQIVGGGVNGGRFIRASVTDSGSALLEIPEAGGVVRAYPFGSSLSDGAWHLVSVRFDPPGVAAASVDGAAMTELTLDADVGGAGAGGESGLAAFVDGGYVVVGAQVRWSGETEKL